MGLSGIFTDETIPPQGAGHLAVIVLLRVRFSGGVFVKGVLVGRTVPPPRYPGFVFLSLPPGCVNNRWPPSMGESVGSGTPRPKRFSIDIDPVRVCSESQKN